jgi:hypothetical protein
MVENRFISVPCVSLTPNRLSMYNKIVPAYETVKASDKNSVLARAKNVISNLANSETGKISRWHNYQLSQSARKSMQLKINWLYFMSKSRYKKNLEGKEIYNFKINFMTLTLPSAQIHPTSVITKECFNQFLTEIRERFSMVNYVWRLEFQKNGNVHYHIVTDVFCEFHIVQKIWNRCIGKLGYVKAYHDKHSLMSLNDYVNAYSNEGKVPFDVLKKRFFRGKALNWSSPNSVDVKSVGSGKKIAFYISKYFGKKQNDRSACNALDNEENSQGIRLWFCSRSLSKLDKITDFYDNTKFDFLYIVTCASDTLQVVHDYCTSYFFSFSSLLAEGKEIIYRVLTNYAKGTGYSPAIC